jgi:hypothetical protein
MISKKSLIASCRGKILNELKVNETFVIYSNIVWVRPMSKSYHAKFQLP